MTRVDEIAADIFRISMYVPDFDIQFNQFLIRDDEPLLFETGMRQIFPLVRETVSRVLDPASLRYVSFSHFEPDECGSLNEWLTLAPRAFRFKSTPHLPHGWDAGFLFEETTKTLLCSDLLGHAGDVQPVTGSDVVGRFADTTKAFQGGPMANYMPYTPHTEAQLKELASLKPRACATMHGSTFLGDGERALLAMAVVMKDLLG